MLRLSSSFSSRVSSLLVSHPPSRKMSSASERFRGIREALDRFNVAAGRSNTEKDSDSGEPPLEIIWQSHDRWPLPPSSDSTSHLQGQRKKLNISVLDSSFNPPTNAHLALANLPQPSTSTSKPLPFDAHLLLFSNRNADKVAGKGDASALQRLEMMRLLADGVRTKAGGSSPSAGVDDRGQEGSEGGNVAVACLAQPIFVAKSTLLLGRLSDLLSRTGIDTTSKGEPRLHFILGWDTLIRVFDPKYYDSSSDKMRGVMDHFFFVENSSILCARRPPSSNSNSSSASSLKDEEDKYLSQDFIRPYVESGHINVVDLPPDVDPATTSSTAARKAVREVWRRGDLTEVGKRERTLEELRDLVPEEVARYVVDAGLYRE